MEKNILSLQILLLILTNSLISGAHSAATFTFVNKCSITVWPGILSNAGITPLPTTGFVLQSGQTQTLHAPSNWGGRFWGRTHCTTDSSNRFTCLTGDCGSGTVECTGGATPPATLAEFTLNGDSNKDFYDVSLVDGYNLPMLVVPQVGSGQDCNNTGCVRDLNLSGACPNELRVTDTDGTGVACKSACEAFRTDEYCCAGAFGTPDKCTPSQYSVAFKSACPSAYSYAYDDRTSTFTCTGANYVITFCPSPNTSQKSSNGAQNPGSSSSGGQTPGSGDTNNNNTPRDPSMIYEGALDVAAAAPATLSQVFGVTIAIVVALLWRL